MQLKSLKHYDNIKQKHKKYSKIWKKYAPANIIGSCCKLFDGLEVTTYQDFLDKYLKNGELRPLDKLYYKINYGRSLEEIKILAFKYLNEIKKIFNVNDITHEECTDLFILHIIIETYNGKIAENNFKSFLLENGWEITLLTEHSDDSKRGIDILASLNDKSFIFQVKPSSAFLGDARKDLLEDRIGFYKKEKLALEKYPYVLDYYYIIYDSFDLQTKGRINWLYKNNSFLIKIEELVDKKDGKNKLTKQDFLKTNKLNLDEIFRK